jgi:hypothetical protein
MHCNLNVFLYTLLLRWLGHVQRMEENKISKKGIIYEFGNDKAEG